MSSQLPLRLQHLLLGADPSTGKIVNLATVNPQHKQGESKVDHQLSGRPAYASSHSDNSSQLIGTRRSLTSTLPSPPSSRNGLGLFVDDPSHESANVSPLFTYKPLAGPTHARPKASSPPRHSKTDTHTDHAGIEREIHSYHRSPPSPPFSANGNRPRLSPSDVTHFASPSQGRHPSPALTATRQLALSPIMGLTSPRLTVPPSSLLPHRRIDLPRVTSQTLSPIRQSPGPLTLHGNACSHRAHTDAPWSPDDLPAQGSVQYRPPLARCATSIADLHDHHTQHQRTEHRPASWPSSLRQLHDARFSAETSIPKRQRNATKPTRKEESSNNASPRPTGPDGEIKDTGANARRATKACDRCRMHKIRCQVDLSLGIDDGTCGRCVQSGAVCSYFRPRKKRGPTSKVRI